MVDIKANEVHCKTTSTHKYERITPLNLRMNIQRRGKLECENSINYYKKSLQKYNIFNLSH